MTPQESRHMRFYSLVLVLNIGVLTMFGLLFFPEPPVHAYIPMRMPVVPRQEAKPLVSGTPVRIVAPSVQIDLPVDVGSYDPKTSSWTLGTDKAYYADMSVPANDNNGVTLIYGHAQAPVFGRLTQLQPGAKALVYTDTKHVFTYTFVSAKNVIPTDTSIFETGGPPTLVLQTCAGAWDAYRAMYSFQLIGQEMTDG